MSNPKLFLCRVAVSRLLPFSAHSTPSARRARKTMLDSCVPHHDWFTAFLTAGLCAGLIISYLPQHLRIISKKSSEGFSPWFLLLGSTSSAAGMLNMVTLQWGVIKCCRVFSIGTCVEMTAGVVQVGLMWFLFTVILVLYMLYYPPHLKYVDIPETDSRFVHDSYGAPRPLKPIEPIRTNHWALSIILSWVVAIHLLLLTFVTFFLLLTTSPEPAPPPLFHEPLIVLRLGTMQIQTWATFLGVSSAVLAATQYAPQIYHTYHSKLVGALSIKMMLIQTPGTIFMIVSIALRPGTNWTSWIMYAVSGVMQGTLLVMCIAWTYRQKRLGIDDFGRPIDQITAEADSPTEEAYRRNEPGHDSRVGMDAEESTPLLAGTNGKR